MTNDENVKVPKYKRRLKNYLIYPRLQLALVFGHVLILIGGFIAIYYQVATSFQDLNERALENNIMVNHHYKELVIYQESFILDTIFSTLILSVVVSVFFTIVFTHKSAGAIYGIKKFFREVNEKGYHRYLTFRKSDLHQDLPPIINQALDKIKKEAKEDHHDQQG